MGFGLYLTLWNNQDLASVQLVLPCLKELGVVSNCMFWDFDYVLANFSKGLRQWFHGHAITDLLPLL